MNVDPLADRGRDPLPDGRCRRVLVDGGRRGILVITGRGRTICGKAQVATASFAAQSGKAEQLSPRLATPDGA